jgi:hypothetical protein
MIFDLDAFPAAKLMLEQHGEDAATRAAEPGGEMIGGR